MALVDQLTRRSPRLAPATSGDPMINAVKALADLEAVPGEVVAVPKAQFAELLRELALRQPAPQSLSIFRVVGAAAA